MKLKKRKEVFNFMRSVNKVILIGNVTWQDALKHTDNGKVISNFGLATNRNWKTEDGEQHEEADYHRLVAFGKLAEFCSEYVRRGRKLYIEGRLHSHSRTDNQVVQKAVTEIILDDVVLL